MRENSQTKLQGLPTPTTAARKNILSINNSKGITKRRYRIDPPKTVFLPS
jgi:hypothetical protein